MSLVTTIAAQLGALLTAPNNFGTPSFNMQQTTFLAGTLATGTGADKADQLYTLQNTLGAGGIDSINLYTMARNGLAAPTDALGNGLTVAAIKLLALKICGNLGAGYVSAAAIQAAGSGYTVGSQVLTLVGGIYAGSVVIHTSGGGSGYAVGDILTLAGGTGTAATVKVLTVSAGAILTLAVLTPGAYSVTPTVTSNAATGGSGSGASLDVTTLTGVAGQLTVTCAAGAVTAVTSVSLPGSYVALPPTAACTVTGGGGTGATFNLTLGTRTASDAVFVEGDYLTIGGVGSTAGWTSILAPNTATKLQKSGTLGTPGTWLETEGGAIGYVVGSGATNNILKLVNSGTSPVTYQLLVVGATA